MSAEPSPLALPPENEWSPAQVEAAKLIRSGPRGALFGPFVPLLNSPELMTRLQLVGEFLRFDSTLPNELFELSVLVVARHWNQPFEWGYHAPLALAAGVPEQVIDDVAAGRRPRGDRADFAAVSDAVSALLETGRLPDASLELLTPLGRPAIVELIAGVGYYTTLAFTLNVAGTPAPESDFALPELV